MTKAVNNFLRSQAKWENLHSQEAFSAPAGVGKVAILASGWSYLWDKDQEIRDINTKAERLQEEFEAEGRGTDLRIDCRRRDFERILQDASISDVYLIGNGNFSAITMGGRTDTDHFGWLGVSQATTHLKTGRWVQLTCGLFATQPPVPMGLFAVTDARNIWAKPGRVIDANELDRPLDQLVRPVTNRPAPLTLDYIASTFTQNQAPLPTPHLVLPIDYQPVV